MSSVAISTRDMLWRYATSSPSRLDVFYPLAFRLSAGRGSARRLSDLNTESNSQVDHPPTSPTPADAAHSDKPLNILWSKHSMRLFRYLHPSLPLSLVGEIVSLVNKQPDEKPMNIPDEEVERRVLEIAGKQGDPPREAVAWIAERFWRNKYYKRTPAEFDGVTTLVVERLLRISWNNGDTEWPRAGAALIRPFQIWNRTRARLLCSQEEAAEIYSRLMIAKDDVSLHTALSWARRLEHIIRSQKGERTPEGLQQLQDYFHQFHQVIGIISELVDQSSSTESKWEGLMLLAHEYATAHVLTRNGEKAKDYWEQAFSLRPSRLLPACHLGLCYLGHQPDRFGKDPLFQPDVAKGLAYLELAKKISGLSAYHIGRRYYRDPGPQDPSSASLEEHVKTKGVEPDDERAAENFYLAMKQGTFPGRIAYVEMILLGRAHPPVVGKKGSESADSAGSEDDALEVTEDESDAGEAVPEERRTQFAARPGDGNILYAFSLAKAVFNTRKNDWSRKVSPESPIRKIFDSAFRKAHADMFGTSGSVKKEGEPR